MSINTSLACAPPFAIGPLTRTAPCPLLWRPGSTAVWVDDCFHPLPTLVASLGAAYGWQSAGLPAGIFEVLPF